MSKANVIEQTQSKAAELQALADMFLASKGVAKVEDAKEAKLPEPAAASTELNLLIGVPCFGGLVNHLTTSMLINICRHLDRKEIPHTLIFIANESLISRARNFYASVAAFGEDSSGKKYSHLLQIDSDQSFDAGWIFKMLDADLPVVGLPCSRKSLNFGQISEAAKRGIPQESLSEFGGSPVLAINKSFVISDDPAPVVHIGTGVVCISVEKCLRPLAEAFPERRYRPNCNNGYEPKLEWHHDFFRVGVRDTTYLSEDYTFCEDCLKIGIQPYVLPLARTLHIGQFPFVMNMSAVGSLLAAVGQNK